MKEEIVSSVVKAAVPEVLGSISEITKEFVGPVCQAVTAVGCKNQIVLAEAIAKIGPELVQYSGEIATKLVNCAIVAKESNCRESELIVKAVLDDSISTISEKVEMVIRWKNSQTDRTVRTLKAVGDALKNAGKGVAATIGAYGLAKKGPEMVKYISKAAVQSKKSSDRTQRSKAWAKTAQEAFKAMKKAKKK